MVLTLTLFRESIVGHDGQHTDEWPLAVVLALKPRRRTLNFVAFGHEAKQIAEAAGRGERIPGAASVVFADDPWWAAALSDFACRPAADAVAAHRDEICVVHPLKDDPWGHLGVSPFVVMLSTKRPWYRSLWPGTLTLQAGEPMPPDEYARAAVSAASIWPGRLHLPVGAGNLRVPFRSSWWTREFLALPLLGALWVGMIWGPLRSVMLPVLLAIGAVILYLRWPNTRLQRSLRERQLRTLADGYSAAQQAAEADRPPPTSSGA